MNNPPEVKGLTEDTARQRALKHTYEELGQRILPSEGAQQADGSWLFNLAIVGHEPDSRESKQISGASLTVRPDGQVDGPTREELIRLIRPSTPH